MEGEAAAAQEGLIGFSFKDASGNVVLPQLNAQGKILVDTEEFGGTCLYDYGSNAGSVSAVDIATLDESVVTVSNIYEKFEVAMSCFRETIWELVYIDDANGTPAETILFDWVTGPGQYFAKFDLKCVQQDTTGGTGDQNLVLRGTNLGPQTSTMRGLLACQERAAD